MTHTDLIALPNLDGLPGPARARAKRAQLEARHREALKDLDAARAACASAEKDAAAALGTRREQDSRRALADRQGRVAAIDSDLRILRLAIDETRADEVLELVEARKRISAALQQAHRVAVLELDASLTVAEDANAAVLALYGAAARLLGPNQGAVPVAHFSPLERASPNAESKLAVWRDSVGKALNIHVGGAK